MSRKRMRSEIIALECTSGRTRVLSRKAGHRPFIWVGDETCYGVVPDRSIRRLKRWCEEILRRNADEVRQ